MAEFISRMFPPVGPAPKPEDGGRSIASPWQNTLGARWADGVGKQLEAEYKHNLDEIKAMANAQKQAEIEHTMSQTGQATASAGSADPTPKIKYEIEHNRAVEEYGRRLAFECKGTLVSFFDSGIMVPNITTKEILIVVIVRGETITFNEPMRGFPSQELVAKIEMLKA